jgi:hypothetical protein
MAAMENSDGSYSLSLNQSATAQCFSCVWL